MSQGKGLDHVPLVTAYAARPATAGGAAFVAALSRGAAVCLRPGEVGDSSRLRHVLSLGRRVVAEARTAEGLHTLTRRLDSPGYCLAVLPLREGRDGPECRLPEIGDLLQSVKPDGLVLTDLDRGPAGGSVRLVSGSDSEPENVTGWDPDKVVDEIEDGAFRTLVQLVEERAGRPVLALNHGPSPDDCWWRHDPLQIWSKYPVSEVA